MFHKNKRNENMQRRNFLSTLSIGALATTWMPTFPVNWQQTRSNGFDLTLWHQQNDQRVQGYLEQLEKRPEHSYFGGLPNADGIYHPISTATMLQFMAVALVSHDSSFFQQPTLEQYVLNAAKCLLNMQHEDGTIDLVSTNFHSTPDTGFVVEPLCLAYTLLQKNEFLAILPFLRDFLLRAGEALSVGGIHTPNHRWVICMALTRLNHLFPNERYMKRIEEWLYEKIDIDPDGQYTEHSTHIYSPLTNRCFITMARLLNRPEFLDPVRQNLEMTLYYLHPNGELLTEGSGRQDRYVIGSLDSYYYSYRFMAIRDKNALWSKAVETIEQYGSNLSGFLPYVLEDETQQSELLTPTIALPTDYFKHFAHSNIVHIRKGNYDGTIFAENPILFKFTKGKAVLQAIRFASAFFGKGQMVASSMKIFDEGVLLEQTLSGPYYQPYPIEKLPTDGDWDKMPRSNRIQSEVQQLNTTIWIKPSAKNGFSLTFKVTGTDHVPVAIELAFRKGGSLKGVQALPNLTDAWLLPSSSGTYTFEKDVIEFGKGSTSHQWTQLRGALPKFDALSVYVTGFTPFEHTLTVEGK